MDKTLQDAMAEHATYGTSVMLLVLITVLLGFVFTARRGRELYVRRIPGVDAIREAVGRATEMGKPVFFSIGLGGIDIVTLQALSIAGYVARLAAKYGTKVIVPVVSAPVYPVAEQVLKEAYLAEGKPEAFSEDQVRFLSGEQFAYAAAYAGMMHREKAAANLMFGLFYAESLILAENGQSLGAIQVAGTVSTTQIPFFIATCDYTIIGEEYYATSAYLTRDPTLLGSLVGQDYAKLLTLLLVVGGVALATLAALWPELAGFDMKQLSELYKGLFEFISPNGS